RHTLPSPRRTSRPSARSRHSARPASASRTMSPSSASTTSARAPTSASPRSASRCTRWGRPPSTSSSAASTIRAVPSPTPRSRPGSACARRAALTPSTPLLRSPDARPPRTACSRPMTRTHATPGSPRRAARLLASLALAVLLSGSASAQYGKIQGTVTDAATGEPLPGVNVLVEGTAQGTATDFDGRYTIIGVRPDTYTLVFSFIGYRTARIEGVRVSIDVTTTTDIALQEEVFEGEEIVVTAERELVQRDLTATTAFVSGDEIKAL